MSVEVVADLGHAQELRQLRNECRHWMTGSTAEVTEEQQREWFGTQVATNRIHAWLLRIEGTALAYAILRPAGGPGWWLSCGVAENARRRGLGTLIVRLATDAGLRAGGPVRLEVWQGNHAARRTYVKCGYQVTGIGERGGRVLEVMEAR